jgi:hypothetical protein
MLVHVVVQTDRPVNTTRLARLPRQLGILLLSLAYILARVLSLVVLGDGLGQVAVHVLHLGVAAAGGEESATGARVRFCRQVDGIIGAQVVNIEMGAVG